MPAHTSFEELQQAFSENRISRRRFIRRASALGFAAAVPASLLSAQAQAMAPKKGGHLRVGIGGGATGDSLDPANYANSFTQSFGSALHSSLTEIGPDGASLFPAAAEEWEGSAGATVWTFRLRQGLTAHNGKTVGAEDAMASLNYHRGEDSKSSAKPFLSTVTDIEAVDARTLRITLSGPNVDFPWLLSDFRLVMMPSAGGKPDVSGVGVGAYVLESFDPGVRGVLKRNPDFYNPDRGHVDSAEFLTIADSTARTTALITGQIDFMDRCELKTVNLLMRNKGVTVLETKGTQHYTIPMDITRATFSDVNVRLALMHAIDREALVETILHGYGAIGNDHPIASSTRFFNRDLPQRPYDPDRAMFHVKKAGLDKLSVSLSASDAAFAGCEDAAVLYSEHAKKAGIEIKVVREPKDGYWSNVWMKKPWSFSYWFGSPIADRTLTTTYLGTAAWNETRMNIPEFDKLLIAARGETDEARRAEMYAEMQKIIHERGGALTPMFASYVNAHSDKLTHGPEVSSSGDLDGLKFVERWWFA